MEIEPELPPRVLFVMAVLVASAVTIAVALFLNV